LITEPCGITLGLARQLTASFDGVVVGGSLHQMAIPLALDFEQTFHLPLYDSAH